MTVQYTFAIALGVSLALIIGCGGQTVDPGPGPESTGSRGGSTGSTRNGAGGDTGVDLPACVKGREIGTGTCPWLGADGLCYDDKLGACACNCPRDHDSLCSSGLPGNEYSQTRVECF